MTTIGDVADALANTLTAVTGLRAEPFIPETINPPALFVSLGMIEESTLGYESFDVPFDAVVLVSRSSARIGQGRLYDYASPTGPLSIWAAIGNNQSLGLTGVRARIARYRPLGIEEIAAYGFFGGAFEMRVTIPGA